METKRCSRGEQCVHPNGPVLMLSEFYANKIYHDEHYPHCKYCHRAAVRKYQQTEEGKAAQRRSRRKIRARQKNDPRWREKQRGYMRKYDATNPARRTRNRDPQRTGVRVRRRQARMRSLPATLTLSEWRATLAYYDHRCAYCGTKHQRLVQEHVIPVVQGGGYTHGNIVPSCWNCNSRKGGRTPEQAGMRLIKPIPHK